MEVLKENSSDCYEPSAIPIYSEIKVQIPASFSPAHEVTLFCGKEDYFLPIHCFDNVLVWFQSVYS